MTDDEPIPDDAQHVGDVSVICPECEIDVPIGVFAWVEGNPGEERLRTESQMTDLWAHMFTHYEGESND